MQNGTAGKGQPATARILETTSSGTKTLRGRNIENNQSNGYLERQDGLKDQGQGKSDGIPGSFRGSEQGFCGHCDMVFTFEQMLAHLRLRGITLHASRSIVVQGGRWVEFGHPIADRRSSCGPEDTRLRESRSDRAQRHEQPVGRSGPDPTRLMDSFGRDEGGRFGSHPTFDGMDD